MNYMNSFNPYQDDTPRRYSHIHRVAGIQIMTIFACSNYHYHKNPTTKPLNRFNKKDC